MHALAAGGSPGHGLLEGKQNGLVVNYRLSKVLSMKLNSKVIE